ncbi:MAG TPA: ABC-2 family transporter protein [Opitutaceae bacterium]|jgi:ABC-2 type transport system permease protein|nr:ABC-2 family transporter protein [Opitutaceae bacterium]
MQIWLACARYSIVRTMMFRFDFIMWALVELFWMSVNLLLIGVLYSHTQNIAGWNKYEMLLLVGTSMLIQRLLMGFFWSNLFEMSRNVRTGQFDFFLAQPGNPLFMVSTRKLDPDSLLNSFVALGVIGYAIHHLGLHVTPGAVALYTFLVFCGLAIHYSALLIVASLALWVVGLQGLEGTYFTLFEFSRLPREAFRGITSVLFVYALPVVVVSNVPAHTLLHGFQPAYALWLMAAAVAWFAVAVFVFTHGLRRYTSASS